MSILQATSNDLIEILYLLKICFHDMKSSGSLHWNLQFQLISSDLNKGNIYLYKKNGVTLGMITMEVDTYAEHKSLTWNKNTSKPLVAHRLAVHPNWKRQGIENEILQFIEQFANLKGYTSIFINALAETAETISIYNKLHFQESDKIQFHFQKIPFTCA